MDGVAASLKGSARRTVRHLVWLTAHVASRRPWMVRLVARVLAAFPSLKHRIRRLINEPATASRREDSLTAAEARVLVDLREAIADRREARR